MNKRIIKILLSIWVVIALFFSGVLIYCINYSEKNVNVFNLISFNSGSLSIEKDETISLENCNEILVDFSSDDIIIYTTDESDLRVVQKSTKKLKEEEKFTIKKDNDKIRIEKGMFHQNSNVFIFGGISRKIELYIPKNYTKDLDVSLSSGDITFNSDIKINKLKCVQSSGDFRGKNNITANEVFLKASSGDITAENLKVKAYDLVTSSGDIRISSLWGTGEVSASSGDISIELKEVSEYIKATTQSGDVKLKIPSTLSFEFYGECSSGDITANFNLDYEGKRKNKATTKIGTEPYRKIDVNTSSGDIKITK